MLLFWCGLMVSSLFERLGGVGVIWTDFLAVGVLFLVGAYALVKSF